MRFYPRIRFVVDGGSFIKYKVASEALLKRVSEVELKSALKWRSKASLKEALLNEQSEATVGHVQKIIIPSAPGIAENIPILTGEENESDDISANTGEALDGALLSRNTIAIPIFLENGYDIEANRGNVQDGSRNHPPRGNVDNQDKTQVLESDLNDFQTLQRNLFVGSAEQEQSNTSDDDERTPIGYATQPEEQFHISSEARRRHSMHNTTRPVERPVESAWTSELEERTRVLEMAMGKILSHLIPDDLLIPLLNRGEQPAAVVATRNSPTLSNIVVPTRPRGNPDEHLHTYQAIIKIQNATDAMMCKVFPATLKSTARRWYHKLPRHSIALYSELTTLFSKKFVSQREIKHTATELMQVHQNEGESLRDYMQQFNKSTLDIDNVPNTICLSALLHGLKPGRFLDDLLENPPKSWNEVNDKLAGFILSEDFQSSNRRADDRQGPRYWHRYNTGSRDLLPKRTIPHKLTEMQLNLSSLRKYKGPIYEFDNQPVLVEGVITLPIYVGVKPRFRMASVGFLVVKMDLAFNTIMGRAKLYELKAVISQPHLCMKFPTPQGAEPVESVETIPLSPDELDKTVKIGTKLTPEERTELLEFLKDNKDVFAWTADEMPGIPTEFTVHKLSTDPTKKPVVQKRGLVGLEKQASLGELNILTCPKDPHPLPNVEKLVERAAGHERMSFLDVSLGYHQVQLLLDDQEKMTFYAGDAIYCYVMMLFGLKNVGATYQKLVQVIVKLQIGRNIEIYVDDMIVTSLRAKDHVDDLKETFQNLRRAQMKLNQLKCTFAVEAGKFLGYVVSKKGIEVNPDKVEAVQQMESLKTIKDVQRLIGRLTALHRFIARLTAAEETTQPHPVWALYVDGAANVEGSRAGAVLLGPDGFQSKHALRFKFQTTNNAVEYKALIYGLKLASELKAQSLRVFSDSQLVVNQVNGSYDIKDPQLGRYLFVVNKLKSSFISFQIDKIQRADNRRANELSKLASSQDINPQRITIVEMLDAPSYTSLKVECQVLSTDPSSPSWTTPLIKYLQTGELPEDSSDARLAKRLYFVSNLSHSEVQNPLYEIAFAPPLSSPISAKLTQLF
ncbi:hypothetical protein SLEP1_g40798 [Rubroshorea leprosula]|uniref:RNase H type-1 domain-containing protein n=1 Tax=Rubroshorea leprosula TaxID=152421 RepID=A0AAV5L550_9ROSI|nr:hypothetical protein SLEP1_g40798 [Rubroshorea leprosula]